MTKEMALKMLAEVKAAKARITDKACSENVQALVEYVAPQCEILFHARHAAPHDQDVLKLVDDIKEAALLALAVICEWQQKGGRIVFIDPEPNTENSP